MQQNLFEGAFSDAEIAPPENAFFPPCHLPGNYMACQRLFEHKLANTFLATTDPSWQAWFSPHTRHMLLPLS